MYFKQTVAMAKKSRLPRKRWFLKKTCLMQPKSMARNFPVSLPGNQYCKKYIVEYEQD